MISLRKCAFEVRCMAILGIFGVYKSLYTPLGVPLVILLLCISCVFCVHSILTAAFSSTLQSLAVLHSCSVLSYAYTHALFILCDFLSKCTGKEGKKENGW